MVRVRVRPEPEPEPEPPPKPEPGIEMPAEPDLSGMNPFAKAAAAAKAAVDAAAAMASGSVESNSAQSLASWLSGKAPLSSIARVCLRPQAAPKLRPASADLQPRPRRLTISGLLSTQASGEVAMIGGVDGPVALRKIPEKAPIALGAAEIGSGRPYVGDIPGLAALDGLGAEAGPAAVLGTDVLRQRPTLVLRDGRVFV